MLPSLILAITNVYVEAFRKTLSLRKDPQAPVVGLQEAPKHSLYMKGAFLRNSDK